MKKTMKKILCSLLVVIMCLTSAPLCGLDFTVEAADYKVGDIIEFGSYPQSKVKDSATINALNNLAPKWDDWTSYGYYSGTNDLGSMVQGDWMRYIDVMYNGNEYRGVKFIQYRPAYTYRQTDSKYTTTYQDDNNYSTNIVYWFKFEPIDWRILDPVVGLVMCETIIDSQPYSNTIYDDESVGDYSFFNDASYTNYANDYVTSSIRKWLNDDFYYTAFTASERNEINTVKLNNDGYNTLKGYPGYEGLDSNETNDKIYLLSYNDTENSNYGFYPSGSIYDSSRMAKGTDYAKSQGLYVNEYHSKWLLRSPGRTSSEGCFVGESGLTASSGWVYFTYGIRPALCLNRISGAVNPNTPTDPDTPTDKPKEEPRDFSDYEVVSGRFEKITCGFDMNGNECITEVVVDGKKYKMERDYEIPGLSSDTIEHKLGKEVAFAILDGEIVMFESIDSISDYCVTAQIEDDLALSCGYGYMTSYKDAIIGESFKENKELKLNAYSLIDRNHLIVRSVDFDEELLEYILSQIPETQFYIEKIQLKLRKTDVISFNGKDTYTISVNSNLKSDQTLEKLVPIKVKSEYEMPEDKEFEKVIFDIVITGTRNGEKVEFTNTDHISIYNGEYVEPTKDKNTNKPTGKQYAKEAAEKLDAISGAITLTGLWELFSNEELEYIGNVLLAEVAMAEAPKETLEEYLSKKVIDKLFNIDSGFLKIGNEEIEVTVAGDTKYGEIKLKLICKYSKVAFSGSDFCFTGQVNYEVIGGKGAKKLPGSFKKSGLAGMFSSVDMESFCNSAYKLFETHLHSGVDEVWGNDVDGAADLVFGTIVNDVLAKTELKSVSNIAFELITKPGKSVTVRCPVDVYVYNANNELVAAVVGNEVILTDDKAQISVDGDVKTVRLFDESYNIVYRAIADGEMQITVEEYGTSSGLLNSSTITEIPLIAGRTYTQNIDDEYMEDSDYTVLSASGNKYTPDSTYTTLDGHNYVLIASKEGTCEEGGSKLYACIKCKEFYKEIVPSAHKYRIVDSGKVPTCTEDGYTSSMKCSTCGSILEGETIKARGHDFRIIGSGKAPTCTEDGYTSSMKCTVCGNVIAGATLKARGHDYIGSKCKNCGLTNPDNCSCNCHKGGIAGFFFKLILFFQKLFRTNQTCSCGVNHY